MARQIKWGCIQPLTGGMYIGALEAIGHHAEWIISYDGLDAFKTNKDGEITSAGNEYNLRQWLAKQPGGDKVPYYQISNRKMFDADTSNTSVEMHLGDNYGVQPDYEGMDLVVAVPVCSGLSVVTSANDDTKNARNCNMLWIAHYTLNVIKPKMYIFENAPTLVGGRGVDIRRSLERMAKRAGYSVLYYKTDTVLHHNCQRRPRTFIIFTQWRNGYEQLPPAFDYENDRMTVPEFFDTISENASQQVPVASHIQNYATIDYIVSKHGEDWADAIEDKINVIQHVIKSGEYEDFMRFIDASSKYTDAEKAKVKKYYQHIFDKTSVGLNYYGEDACLFKKYFPSVQFKTIRSMIHHSGRRFCTVREFLSLMGMPEDFELYGDASNLPKIGQNVPVKTAKFIVSQAVEAINDWDKVQREMGFNVMLQDNIKPSIQVISKHCSS